MVWLCSLFFCFRPSFHQALFSQPVSQAHSQVASALGGEIAETFFKDVLACRSKLRISKFFSFYFFSPFLHLLGATHETQDCSFAPWYLFRAVLKMRLVSSWIVQTGIRASGFCFILSLTHCVTLGK